MVGEIKRNYLSGTKLVTEKRPTWRDSGINEVVNSVAGAVEAGNNYFEREKQLVWKRLNLEAANLQTEELNAIKTAKSVEEIPGIVKNFQKKLKENMRGQKWGKEWMENQINTYLDLRNQIDEAVNAEGLPGEKEINELVRNGALTEEQAGKLRTAREKKEADFKPGTVKVADTDKFSYYENVETKIAEVIQKQENGMADLSDFEGLSESLYGGFETQKIKLHFANLSEGRKREVIKSIVDKLKTQGYDGIIIKNTQFDSVNPDERINQYVVFEPNQIKSVDNRGSFSRTDDNIYYQMSYFDDLGFSKSVRDIKTFLSGLKPKEEVRLMFDKKKRYWFAIDAND